LHDDGNECIGYEMAWLTVEDARQLTADAKGRRVGAASFRRLVNDVLIPAQVAGRNPVNRHVRIDEDRFLEWRRNPAAFEDVA
jgi:hypothetical protein